MKKILFVCVENSNRSQMAQAFTIIHGKDKMEAYSAGSNPSGVINPKAIESMKEIGYELSTHKSKSLDEIPIDEYEYVITMGCGDECPFIPAKNHIEWQIPDPKTMDKNEFRKIRNLIEEKVKDILEKINNRSELISSDRSEVKDNTKPLSCKLTTSELQTRKKTVIESLRKQMLDTKELPNGYAFKFAGSDQMLEELEEFIKTERECCDFFIFNLAISGDKSEAWLELTGVEGTKDFITTELAL